MRRHVGGFQLHDLEDAPVTALDLNHDPVSGPDRAVRLAVIAVDLDAPPFARGLRLGARLENAGDVEPDVEPYGCFVSHDQKVEP
jgi:hypothetical protein